MRALAMQDAPDPRADLAVIRELHGRVGDLLNAIERRYMDAAARLSDQDVAGATELSWELRAALMTGRQSELDVYRGTLSSLRAAAGRVLGPSAR